MGRLRNFSESLKAAAFHNSSSSSSSPVLNQDPSTISLDTTTREHPLAAKESSASSLPQSTPPASRAGNRSVSRPTSMVYTPPSVEPGKDTQIEELSPVFSFLSSHNNKLYQEGYFLKLNDLDTSGKPNSDRNWTECFAQLVGTVLSLWDAAALDAAGQDGEVPPTFINLADASIKMIETLPTRNEDVQPLQNVLSISTAGKNRYLLHFNSLHSLTQWTAGIRLAMFEHASLQELYTGSLIAGKGKHLNNIRQIMERTKFRSEDWARVRFGAGTPWRRCWCVIEPPDEKEWQKANKSLKKRSAYERPQLPKGAIKFYDTKKTKKASPIATITDAYSIYSIYPQSKPLIDQSTLIKVEGRITIHSNPESKTEGFVFVMPEVHPAVSGFEMMLRWLFPVYDSFHLYGRPNRLIADTLDPRGIMFAMPRERRYGYLDIIDVAALIHTDGSDKWTEREWRKQLKDMTSKRMSNTAPRSSGNLGSRRGVPRPSTGSRNGVHYDDNASIRSTPSTTRHQHNQSTDAVFATPSKTHTAPPNAPFQPPSHNYHARSVSENVSLASPSKSRRQKDQYIPSRLSMDQEYPEPIEPPPAPPSYRQPYKSGRPVEVEAVGSRDSSDSEMPYTRTKPEEITKDMTQQVPPTPVAMPPNFQHQPSDRPQKRPDTRPDLRREKSRMSNATLSEMVNASRIVSGSTAGAAAAAAWKTGGRNEDQESRGVFETPADLDGMPANQIANTAMVAGVARNENAYVESPADIEPPPPPQQNPTEQSVSRRGVSPSTSEHSIARKPVPTLHPPVPALLLRTHSSDSVSQYSNSNHQHDSDETPEYASTQKSDDVRSEKSISRVRTGVLKTVGDPALTHSTPSTQPRTDIPVVDFGITRSLTPGPSRPPTAGGEIGRRSPFSNPVTPGSVGQTSPFGANSPSGGGTPNEDKRLSYMGRVSPRPALTHTPSPRQSWQPGTVVGRQSPGPSLTPEEFVQQRAAFARLPSGYAPYRSISAGKIEEASSSPKKLQKKRDPYQRSSSRNSLILDYSSNLSAREQEHVAKMTGGPLITVSNQSRTPDPSVGLIGAIEAREQEKRDIREGVAGHMVQAAVASHYMQAQQQSQYAAERAYMMQQYNGYPTAIDARQGGQWVNPQDVIYLPQDHQQQQQQHPQQQQQRWQNQNQYQYQQRYSGYYVPQDGGYNYAEGHR